MFQAFISLMDICRERVFYFIHFVFSKFTKSSEIFFAHFFVENQVVVIGKVYKKVTVAGHVALGFLWLLICMVGLFF